MSKRINSSDFPKPEKPAQPRTETRQVPAASILVTIPKFVVNWPAQTVTGWLGNPEDFDEDWENTPPDELIAKAITQTINEEGFFGWLEHWMMDEDVFRRILHADWDIVVNPTTILSDVPVEEDDE